jgi:hypothetical protein
MYKIASQVFTIWFQSVYISFSSFSILFYSPGYKYQIKADSCLLRRMSSSRTRSRCSSTLAASTTASHSCTLLLSLSKPSLSYGNACAFMSFIQSWAPGAICSRRCWKPAFPPPPPSMFVIYGPVKAHRKPIPEVTVISVYE